MLFYGKCLLACVALAEAVRGRYIPLAGTVLRDPDDRLYVPYLYWDGGEWLLRFAWLARDWVGGVRFALRK